MNPRNAIPDRIADALRRFPPFSMLREADVAALAGQSRVRVLVAGDTIWMQGDKPGTELLFLARGRVEYVWQVDGRSERVDVRDVGDLLGLTALMESRPSRVTACVMEDSVLYAFPWDSVRALLDVNDHARNYVRRHLFWATRVGGHVIMPDAAVAVPSVNASGAQHRNILQAHLDGAQLVQPRSPDRLLHCLPETPIRDAARMMIDRQVPSILVTDEENRPMGIMTHNNIVRRVVVGGLSDAQPVSAIMSVPVVTVAPRTSATAALLLMLRQRIGQVVVTEDGTSQTRALDICSEKDLLAQSGHHPAGLLREIRYARTAPRFREICDEIEGIARSYLEAGISAIFLGQICAELYDALLQRLLHLETSALAELGRKAPPIAWAWMSVGSDGRREQILRTDMDNALLFASQGDPDKDGAARDYFLALAERTVARLVECGFSRCQGGVMASNPRWCRTDREWRSEVESLNTDSSSEQLLRGTILFDLRHVAGDRAMCDGLREFIFSHAASHFGLLQRLAGFVVETPPPLNFFGSLVVESKGDREGLFDLKSRGMAPIRDAARLFALMHGLKAHHSTGGRLEDMRRCKSNYNELGQLAAEGYDTLLRLRTLNGLRKGDSGRFIDPSGLTKLQRSELANVFDVQRMLQSLVKHEYRLHAG